MTYYITHLVPNAYAVERKITLFKGSEFATPKLPIDKIKVVREMGLPYVITPNIYIAKTAREVDSNKETSVFAEHELKGVKRVEGWGFRQCVLAAGGMLQNALPIWLGNTDDKIVEQVLGEILEYANSVSDETYNHYSQRWEIAAANVKYNLQTAFAENPDRPGDSDFYIVSLLGGAFYNLVMGEHDSFAKVAHYTFSCQATLTSRAMSRVTGTENSKERLATVITQFRSQHLDLVKKYLPATA